MADMMLIGAPPLRYHLRLTDTPDALTRRNGCLGPFTGNARERNIWEQDGIWCPQIASQKICKSHYRVWILSLTVCLPTKMGSDIIVFVF